MTDRENELILQQGSMLKCLAQYKALFYETEEASAFPDVPNLERTEKLVRSLYRINRADNHISLDKIDLATKDFINNLDS